MVKKWRQAGFMSLIFGLLVIWVFAGCSDDNKPPVAKAEVNASSVKHGESVHFSAAGSSDSDGQIVSYTWKDESGSLLGNSKEFDHTFASAGTHTVTLTVTDDGGLSDSDNVTVTVKELKKPIARIDVDAVSAAVGETLHFDAGASSDTDGEIVKYRWLDDTNTTISNQKSFSHAFATSGKHKITLLVTDNDGQEDRATIVIDVEALLVSLSLEADRLSLEVGESAKVTATAHYNDNTIRNINDSVVWVVADTSILTVDSNGTVKTHKSGTTTLQAKVGDKVSNILTFEVAEPVVLQSISVSPNPVKLRVGSSVQTTVMGHYSDGSTKNIYNADYSISDTNIASADGMGGIEGLAEGATTLHIRAGAFTISANVVVAKELNTTNFNFTDFGSKYLDQIPVDANVTKYDEKRFCMITGQIFSEDGSPLRGVSVSIHKHPEYGTTLTDGNGTYAIPAEGGLQLTMRYSKEGFTTIDRKIQAPIQDWVRTPDVTMLKIDTKVTHINLTDPAPQVHISTPVVDDRGERATTLVFDGVTKAVVTAPDGSTRELTEIAVRATEFKTPESMPSDLPNTSAYTYCSDLTVDGVDDDEEVSFDAPVVMYVDNFLGFEVGEIVPVGYYDRSAGEWKASENGVVVKLLDTDGDGKVDALDSTGDDLPDDLNGNGTFSDEVAGLADNASCAAGKSYWRAEITHFTPWDHNWPFGPPDDAEDPKKPDTDSDDAPQGDCNVDISSYVTKKSRVFHEDIPIAGTDITLHYSSKRVEGYKLAIDAEIDTTDAPGSVLSAVATLSVAGRVFTRPLKLGKNNKLSFEWDGKDVLGRKVSGETTAALTVKYTYPMVYYSASSAFASAWARAGSSATAIRGRTTVDFSQTKKIKLDSESTYSNNSNIANGWTFSNIHEIGTNAIYKGDGTKVEKLTSLEDGLIAYYRFEGDVKDSSWQGHDGVEYGGVTYENGIFGKAIKFDGVSGWVDFQTKIVDTIEFSISGYIKLNSTNSRAILFSNNDKGWLGYGIYVAMDYNGFNFEYNTNLAYDEPKYTCNSNGIIPNINQWYFVTATRDTNGILSLYVNGVNVCTQQSTKSIDSSNAYTGRFSTSWQQQHNYSNYAIDELKIYNKTLTQEDINNLYNYGISKQDIYQFTTLNISDKNQEYEFDIDGKHISTKSYPDKKLLETYTYDDNGRLIAITDRFGQTVTITRDANGNPTKITAPNGQITTLTVDGNGDLIEVGYEDDSKYTFTYFDGSLMDTMTDPNGNVITHVWNDTGRIVEEIDGLGGSYSFLRDVRGGETIYSTVLPEGETTTSKDVKLPNGDTQSTITLATGETVTATFAKDESATTIQRDGVETKYIYTVDPLTDQRVLASKEITQPSGLKQKTTYSIAYEGNETHTDTKTQVISVNNKSTTRVVDYNNGRETITTPQGRTALRIYDTDTLLTQSISVGTLTPVTYTYDSKGRLVKKSQGGRDTTYTYDSRGNIASITDPKGRTTSYGYDIMDRLIDVTYPNGTMEHFSYDANGNLLSRTVPTSATHRFTYNGGDLADSYTSALGKQTTYSYDKSGNLIQIVRPSGKKVTYDYDNGRLTKITTPESIVEYSYLFADKVDSITKGGETVSYGYDGTLLTTKTFSGTLNRTISYDYNDDFRLISATYAEQTETYRYDDDGLLIASGPYTITRDAQNGYTTKLTDGTYTQNRSYNGFGEITGVSDNTFGYEITARYPDGRIRQKIETLNGTTFTYDYSYDEMGRLTEVVRDGTLVELYTYDANGNRQSATVNGKTTAASHTLDDQLEVYGDNSYLYDDDGYLIEKTAPEGSTYYTYDTMGALTDVTLPDDTEIHYITDPLNRRISKEVNGTIVEKYLWEDLTTLLAVYDKDDNLVWRFEYADGRMPVSMTDGTGGRFYLHYDQVGSLRAVTDADGSIVKEIVYDSFGNIVTDTDPDFRVPFGFAGGLYDPDTKLTHFGYREYDAYTGKWTAKDPILFEGGDSNLYGYVLNDPVNLVDPWGLSWEDFKKMREGNASAAANVAVDLLYPNPSPVTGLMGAGVKLGNKPNKDSAKEAIQDIIKDIQVGKDSKRCRQCLDFFGEGNEAYDCCSPYCK